MTQPERWCEGGVDPAWLQIILHNYERVRKHVCSEQQVARAHRNLWNFAVHNKII